ncbi:MAG: proton-conducting transporter membrane subunit [Candidatus Omnitrophota bacterium]
MKTLLHPILFSIFAGLLILVFPKRLKKLMEGFSILASFYLLVSSIKIFLLGSFNGGLLYLDNLSRFIVLGIGLFGFLVTLYSIRFMENNDSTRAYYSYIIWSIGFSMLAALSNNIILLLIAWGVLGFTLYMLINTGGVNAAGIAKKTFIIIGGSDSLMILGFALYWLISGSLNIIGPRVVIEDSISFWAFLLIAIGAFTKAGLMPFHTWIPDMAKEAPIPVSAFLPASLDKLLGIYLLARLMFSVFILDQVSYNLLMVLGSVTIIAGVMMALVQHDFRKLLGYHAVSQVGYMVLGLATGNPIGIAGGLFHMVNNAIYKSSLFLTGGNVQFKTNKSDLDSMGGLSKLMPITFICSLIAALSISGIPPFNGFVSKWMVYQGLIERGRSGGNLWVFAIISAMVGSGLTLASFIKFIHAIFLGKAKDGKRETGNGKREEVPVTMLIAPVILSLLCIVFGVFAYAVPLKYLITPALPEGFKFLGTWPSLKATIFLGIGLIVGWLIYLCGNFKGIRESSSYIGGEAVEENMRLSGTEFYGTIKELPFIRSIYAKAEKKAFDIYESGKNIVFFFIKIFRYLHNGVLPTYLAWCLIGMMILFFSLMR